MGSKSFEPVRIYCLRHSHQNKIREKRVRRERYEQIAEIRSNFDNRHKKITNNDFSLSTAGAIDTKQFFQSEDQPEGVGAS